MWKKIIRTTFQVVILCLFNWLGNWISETFQLIVPGGMIGLAMLLICLHMKWIRLEWVEAGANWLLAELLLFFIPSAVGIVQYPEMFSVKGLGITFIIFLSTGMVMLATGVIAERLTRTETEGSYGKAD
ncbi:CidA/LrgA family protein [Hazenella coriacea]|uniref:Holin-like protein n=1 Tax=Hazenella coriacea TaxID=1179467 RepID=A0A4R3L7M3_9BACL|nr:CidA/LrgA family protein [Hazenella coriacea]TCS93496.1 holin-like protein [Hazenella coriacea]